MARWVKQLTRENTLLDRSLRMIAYHESIREIGAASMSKSPVVGFGRVTSLYYNPVDKRQQEKIILKEFRGARIRTMSKAIVRFFEDAYTWARMMEKRRLTKATFKGALHAFMRHHAHARGAIVYGYWGESRITKELRTLLAKKVSAKNLDAALSLLSTPHYVAGALARLHQPSFSLLRKKRTLARRLALSRHEKQLVIILSWFTFFYETGERVSSYLFQVLLQHLRRIVPSRAMFDTLEWYDPESLLRYWEGKHLSRQELARRRSCYILCIRHGRLEVISGKKAHALYRKEFYEKPVKTAHEVRGVIASAGHARGRVRIVVTDGDQKNMRKGDILVSPMTTPKLIVAMKKAAAIVTDEGGMTAHAAIVSRELNIPCIIGTKIATQIFKNGDRVEVNAQWGIVKKI